MASRSLGTLTLDLVAKIGAFTGPLDQASQQAKKRNAEIASSFESLAKGVGLAIGSVPAILTGMVVATNSSAKEISNLAALSGLGTTEFQKYAAGAKSLGIEQDKLSDIFKDTNDKLGDFFNTGGGALKDFFEVIAPKVGVTAEQFKKLNSAEALQLYVSTLEKANVSQAEMTFYMEGIADEATALVPLLRDGGKGFETFGDAAEAAGAILSAQTIAVSKELSQELVSLAQNATGFKNILVAEYLPVLTQFTKDTNAAIKEAGGLGSAAKTAGEQILTATAFIANAGDGVTRVFKIVANTLVGTYATAVAYLSELSAKGAGVLANLPGEAGEEYARQAQQYATQAQESFSVAAQAAAAIKENLETPLAGSQFQQYIADAKAAAAEYQRLFGGDGFTAQGGGGSGADPKKKKADEDAAKAAATAAKKINDAFASTETDYKRQIELINTSTDAQKNATEVDKLRFDIASGKLVGINAEQQKRLEGLASELDALQKLKLANEEEAKSSTYLANIKAANATAKSGFDMELAGAGMGDRARERLQQDLAIQQDYNQQMADLQTQLNAGDISKDLYKKETGLLSEALAERMVIQQDYYNQLDEAQANWVDGVSNAWQNYAEIATDYSQQANDATANLLGDTTSSLSDQIQGLAKGTTDLGDAFVNLGATMGNSVLGALSDIAAQWVVTHALKMAGITAETSLTVASEGTKAAAKVAGDTVATGSTLASLATTVAANVTAAATTVASWLPAALVASIGSFGAAAVVGGAALVAAYALIKGFEDGGYTGNGATNEVVGVVHGQEFVVDAKNTKRIGVDNLKELVGMAHSGIDAVPETGTWLLQKGERVTTAATSAKLDRTLEQVNAGNGSGSRNAPATFGNTTVNLIEDASKAGQQRTRLSDDQTQQVVDVWISKLYSDDDVSEALSRKFGLQGVGG